MTPQGTNDPEDVLASERDAWRREFETQRDNSNRLAAEVASLRAENERDRVLRLQAMREANDENASLRAELARKDQVLEHIRDWHPDYGISEAEVLDLFRDQAAAALSPSSEETG